MAEAAEAQDKAALARQIAHWATHELGFRKKATLVTARGEEKITAADVEPLLQGELARVLERAATHLVSAQTAAQSRQRIAAFCAQPRTDAEDLAHVRLRRRLAELRAREQALEADARSAETASRAAIQSMDEAEAARRAAEARIHELRLQILKKQMLAEDLRRMNGRMRLLVREMTAAAAAAEAPPQGSAGPLEALSAAAAALKDPLGELPDAMATDGDEQAQLQSLNAEEHHIRLVQRQQELRTQLEADESALIEKLDGISSQLRMAAAGSKEAADDYKAAVLQVVIRDAVAHVEGTLGALVPELEAAASRTWAPTDHTGKAADVARAIEQIRGSVAAFCSAAAQARAYAGAEVADAHRRFQQALRYVDLRDSWSAVRIAGLQQVHVETGGGDRVPRATDKLVARSCFSEPERDRRLCHVLAEATGTSGQVRLRIGHMIDTLRRELAAGRRRVEGIVSGGQDAGPGDGSLERAVDDLRAHARQERAAARAATAAWAAESGVARSLQTAEDSAATEAAIGRLSDASGRLFTDSFAPWHRRDGAAYADYVKQLKIARAGDGPGAAGE
ncbi:hypothetical protein H4R18_004122 [Coemansia javaensis]|uniref:Uncharacterized protein n=1 Tax=Coemansia javaensis TaxID=2761396 RepID=A0A9W8HD83_9FUNG|nr:hypothetical protein H4R18_004122 [Coemansia javaensis]